MLSDFRNRISNDGKASFLSRYIGIYDFPHLHGIIDRQKLLFLIICACFRLILWETKFENCVADVNIPVGEVFTSPVLKGTEGVLHVKKVYLRDLSYENLEITFKGLNTATSSPWE